MAISTKYFWCGDLLNFLPLIMANDIPSKCIVSRCWEDIKHCHDTFFPFVFLNSYFKHTMNTVWRLCQCRFQNHSHAFPTRCLPFKLILNRPPMFNNEKALPLTFLTWKKCFTGYSGGFSLNLLSSSRGKILLIKDPSLSQSTASPWFHCQSIFISILRPTPSSLNLSLFP